MLTVEPFSSNTRTTLKSIDYNVAVTFILNNNNNNNYNNNDGWTDRTAISVSHVSVLMCNNN